MESNTVSNDADASEAPAGANRPVSLSDEDDLDEFVADADVALVEFYTDGCGICASMEPVIGNVARGADADLAVGTVNPRDDPPLVERFDVRSVPLFVLFVDGEPVARRAEGFIPGDELTAWVDEHAA
ncbi:co-chaperone YbbN [Halorubrum trapanicum]|uniref:thioredoxin family protein n=1 Tax=Halorubrum trapanicum TaxID=29284 RepID=UPI000BBA8E8D|nr:thioredoxin family protein [Halorubrum trapanicum]